MIDGLIDLVDISQAIGKRQDYIQGGGGNTSVKLDDTLMAIKASGSLLSEMNVSHGFVALKYKDILKYHRETPKSQAGRDYNKEVMDTAIASIVQVNGEPSRRPSVEAGFHALLKRCVIHTHSVYVNILMCSEGGIEKAQEILMAAGISSIWVPCVKPGYFLTEAVIAAMGTSAPDVILIQNHGIIVHTDDAAACIDLHDRANGAVRQALELPAFPRCAVQRSGDFHMSATPWLKEKAADKELMQICFHTPLYPDQLVYLSGSGPDVEGGKVAFEGGNILYRAGESEAQAIEETLSGVAYVADCINKLGLDIHPMNEQDADYIHNWDSEKYRKQMIGK
jgi:ribulose-5-phosphate 4-epimerase/fuculose-1-phosphate aldolase